MAFERHAQIIVIAGLADDHGHVGIAEDIGELVRL